MGDFTSIITKSRSDSVLVIPDRKHIYTGLFKFSLSPLIIGKNKKTSAMYVRDSMGFIAKLVPINNSVPHLENPYDVEIVSQVIKKTNNDYVIEWINLN